MNFELWQHHTRLRVRIYMYMYYERGNPVHQSTVEPLSIMDALTDLSEDGDISTDSLVDVDGDMI